MRSLSVALGLLVSLAVAVPVPGDDCAPDQTVTVTVYATSAAAESGIAPSVTPAYPLSSIASSPAASPYNTPYPVISASYALSAAPFPSHKGYWNATSPAASSGPTATGYNTVPAAGMGTPIPCSEEADTPAATASSAPVSSGDSNESPSAADTDGNGSTPDSDDDSAATSATAPVGTGSVSPSAGFGNGPTSPGAGFKQGSCVPTVVEPVGMASFPINGDNWCAPTPTDLVPEGAAVYTPAASPAFDTLDFTKWITQQSKNGLPSKFLKVKPGTYAYNLGPVHAPGTDTNTVPGTNIAIGFMAGGWTLDLRGVTFVISITAENDNRRPGQMIYINQSEDFTILGGTIWIDVGPMWSYAKMQSVDEETRVGTFQVLEGYNRSVWPAADMSYWCADVSNPATTLHPSCQPWRHSTFDYSKLAAEGSFVAAAPAWGNTTFNAGYVMGTPLGPSMRVAVASENNGNFSVRGMTTNGNFAQYGLGSTQNPPKSPATLTDIWIVAPPPRPGMAPEVQGPVWQTDNLGWANFDPAGWAPMKFVNSFWQTSGNKHDLLDMNDSAPVGLAQNGL